jgi:transketolase
MNADLLKIAATLRGEVVRMSHVAKTPHLASALSCIDILTAAYWGGLSIDPAAPHDPGRDRFILSKGHAATALYATLAYAGFFPLADLAQYNVSGGHLAEHPGPGCAPGVEAATGSLGHGLGLGIGMALAARINRKAYRVFVLMSDGECNEGTVWEGALFAPAQRLGGLCAIVDFNKWQATGRSQEIMQLDPFVDKWRSFGWDAVEVDGHDLNAIGVLMDKVRLTNDRPTAIVAHTVKGKGVSFMEDDNNWHYRVPTADEVAAAFAELGLS